MVIYLDELLPMILCISLIVLVIMIIIICIRLMKTLNKFDSVLDEFKDKMDRVDGVLTLIDQTSQCASHLGDKIINSISGFINSIFRKKKKGDDYE